MEIFLGDRKESRSPAGHGLEERSHTFFPKRHVPKGSRVSVFQRQDQDCTAKDQDTGSCKRDLRVQLQSPHRLPESHLPAQQPFHKLYQIPPDQVSDAAQHNESYCGKVHQGIPRVIRKAVVTDDIHSRVTEGRNCIEQGNLQSSAQPILGYKLKRIEDHPHTFHQQSPRHDLTHKCYKPLQGIQIIGFLYKPSVTYAHTLSHCQDH